MENYQAKLGKEYVGRDSRIRATCPFCGMAVERPGEPDLHRPVEMPVGSCTCGAVYACDITGHNLGTAFTEALVFSCDMDWDLAWNLLPEEDYLEALVENYDLESNYIIPVGSFEGRKVSGALYFIRLHDDIREVTGEAVQQKINRVKASAPPQPTAVRSTKKQYTKRDVEEWVRQYNLDPILEIAAADRRILRDLQRLLYTADELLRLKAADAIGQACGLMSRHNPGDASRLLQKVLTSVSSADYGSSNWGAVDAIGEIIRNAPEFFAGYIPTLYQFAGDEAMRPKVIRAIARIAQVRPDLILKSRVYFIPLLSDVNSETRGFTAVIMGILGGTATTPGFKETVEQLEGLTADDGEIQVYSDGNLIKTTVGSVAAEALSRLQAN